MKIMKSYAICPISNQKINETVARLNGGLTVVTLLAFLLSSNLFIIGFLVVDFLLRSTNNSRFSLFSIISQKIAHLLDLKVNLINAGPKIFAARIGFIFSLFALVFGLLGLFTASYVFVLVFAFCALLEAAFGLCIACEIYPYLYKFIYKFKS